MGMSLSVVVLVALVTVAAVPKHALALTPDRTKGRAFKGGSISVGLKSGERVGRTSAALELVQVPKGMEASLAGEAPEFTLTAGSRFAGVFRGLEVKVGVGDPLGLFVRSEDHRLDVSFEFLPSFLLAGHEPLMVTAAMLGDLPAGRSGFGQEFYSAEVYSTSSSSKDIMWKREAKFPSDKLYVRVGEANNPGELTVYFIEKEDMNERGTPIWMDLVSEAVARIGLQVVLGGTTFRLIHSLDGDARSIEAKDPATLANMVMWLWNQEVAKERARETPDDASIILVGQAETRNPRTMGLVLEKPTVILAWGKRNPVAGTNAAFFTGKEDISGLVAEVLSK